MVQNRPLARLIMAFAVMTISVTFFSFQGNAWVKSSVAAPAPIDKELIIQIEGLNQKNIGAVRKNIEANNGVTFKDICYGNHVLMYVVDRSIHPDNAFIDEALAPLNLVYLLKEGASIVQVQEQCPDSNNNDDLSTPTE